MTDEHDYDEKAEEILRLKEKLGAQEKMLEKLFAKLESIDAKRADVVKEVGGTLNAPQIMEEPPQEMSKLMIAISNLPDVESIVKCDICGKLYVIGNSHECPKQTHDLLKA